ncbi:site-specific DNA-methyltransferase [Mycobacterium avium subsp. hominissuis]|uniref:Site-specific DNA-methyltransferase n=2 Tax=Mycobacterium avium complex (MAC) TaxID=120793 RepID=A0A2A3LA24_MYCAV|nr:DNA methyltransferase [Mycobacterium avium]MBZ4632537.1 site-specific DNA-methyltransferase [Mycobacterium avium subsp. hominissuis]PBJ35972.1 site-specific DNA-methyltransferase [Mycobacterium avium subsp. hominissuis]PBJ67796.1 site-specific DNA-methyltransferase [Mycobacterium avium subsp. hominissuis]QWY65301.1 site-specific DNA-methyltransferase [Mycobacterium avium subsp. hominissuis]
MAIRRLTRQQIRENRKRLALSQAELGDRVGAHQVLVSNWETGKAVPTANQRAALLELFNADTGAGVSDRRRPSVAKRAVKTPKRAEVYQHNEQAVLRPEAGTQAQFKKRREPKRYLYDDSLSPALDWDGKNHARELGEWLLSQIEEAARLDPPHRFDSPHSYDGLKIAGLSDAVETLKRISKPFLDWAGKAERMSFDVPTLPLFVHERLSTKAILETLKAHERDRQMELQLFADPQLPIHQQLAAYEHKGGWTNRLILGDSLVVMNSLLEYEGLSGQVQMIYIDPPYGVKFGSNFQPFVRNRDVRDGDDASMTREIEMVKAFRDTWELGLHSYLTYLRDRIQLARDLLSPTGALFVQIGNENVHHVREVLDEVFGVENFISQITFRKTTGSTGEFLPGSVDFLLFYARDRNRLKFNEVFRPKEWSPTDAGAYSWVELSNGDRRRLTPEERAGTAPLPTGARAYRLDNLQSQSMGRKKGLGAASWFPVELDGRSWLPSERSRWKTNEKGMEALKAAGRLQATDGGLYYVRYQDDFPAMSHDDLWDDTVIAGFTSDKRYVVETSTKVVQRCILMTTNPGDLVLDPTCGSGTTAYVAEHWGRRWITIDTSRVPLALARQRLLTATFPYYELQDPGRGPAGGFVYKRRRNSKGEEVGGIVPHVTLKSIASNEPPAEEVLADRPEVDKKITRVTGPFVVEATIPTPVDIDEDGSDDVGAPNDEGYIDRMLEALRRNPVLQLGGNMSLTLHNVKPPARSLYLSAEACLDPDGASAAIMFGPENGAISEKLVYEAVTEAHMKHFDHLLLIGFAIEPNAREFVAKAEQMVGIPVTYIQATPDLVMGDLLKTTRSSQLFSVAGLPDIAIRKLGPQEASGSERYEVELLGLDTFDPTTFEVRHRGGGDVPAWFLDTDWNELSFHVSQAFFPRTSAWDSLKKALKGEYDDAVWDHLAGTTSAPFTAGENRRVAVKVIDDRGNELLVVKSLDEAQ